MQHDFILLDRSGSMEALWTEALSSVNAYVKKLADDKVDTGVTLATFDTNNGAFDFTIVRDRIIPSTWHKVTDKDATPRGMTPLNDATGRIVSLAEAGNYDKVAIIIMTDGLENASREMTVADAKAALERCRKKNWQVIFLGANFDNAMQAASYGNVAASTVQAAPGKVLRSMEVAAERRAAYSAVGAAMTYSEEEKRYLKE